MASELDTAAEAFVQARAQPAPTAPPLEAVPADDLDSAAAAFVQQKATQSGDLEQKAAIVRWSMQEGAKVPAQRQADVLQ